MLTFTEAERLGLFSLAGVLITAAAAVIVAMIQSRRRATRQATADDDADEVEEAWQQRGRLLDGLNRDLDKALDRIAALEKRADDCERREFDALDALEWAHGEIAALQERLGVTPTRPQPRVDRD